MDWAFGYRTCTLERVTSGSSKWGGTGAMDNASGVEYHCEGLQGKAC